MLPLLEIVLTIPPPETPYWAEKEEVITLNSWIVSEEKVTVCRPRVTEVALAPSAMNAELAVRPPLITRFAPAEGVVWKMPPSSEPTSPVIPGIVSASARELRPSSGIVSISLVLTVVPVIPLWVSIFET